MFEVMCSSVLWCSYLLVLTNTSILQFSRRGYFLNCISIRAYYYFLSTAMEKVHKNKRSGKTIHQQYCLYLNELEENTAFRTNKYCPSNPDVLDNTWEQLVLKLNSTGGPRRTVAQWKKVFTDWKCNVRKRARLFKNAHRETGGGSPPPDKPLTELETKLLALTGKVVVDGLNVTELGTVEEKQEANELELQKETDLLKEQAQNFCTDLDIGVNKDKMEYQADVMSQNESAEPEAEPFDRACDQNKSLSKNLKKRRADNITKIKRRLPQKQNLSGVVKSLLNKKDCEETLLMSINDNLTQLVALKRREIFLLETEIQLKYNVVVEERENDSVP